MNLLNFIKLFPDEDSCKLKMKEIRDKEGVTCKHCGSKDHYWKSDKWLYECRRCKYRTTLRSGTVMHGSQLPFRYWFIAMHLLTSTKKSFSALELQKQLGHKYYEPIWAMLHKLRHIMGKRDSNYVLTGEIELDEGFFSTEIIEDEKGKPLKRGRGSQKKTKVLVMTESRDVPEKTTKKGKTKKVGYIKMKVIPDLKSKTIENQVDQNISKSATLITDDSTSYINLEEYVDTHNSQVVTKNEIAKVLPWVHIAISNAKRLLLNTHHKIKTEYLQSYLDEFCYKFNRRFFGEFRFDRLLIASVGSKNEFRYRIR